MVLAYNFLNIAKVEISQAFFYALNIRKRLYVILFFFRTLKAMLFPVGKPSYHTIFSRRIQWATRFSCNSIGKPRNS